MVLEPPGGTTVSPLPILVQGGAQGKRAGMTAVIGEGWGGANLPLQIPRV